MCWTKLIGWKIMTTSWASRYMRIQYTTEYPLRKGEEESAQLSNLLFSHPNYPNPILKIISTEWWEHSSPLSIGKVADKCKGGADGNHNTLVDEGRGVTPPNRYGSRMKQ